MHKITVAADFIFQAYFYKKVKSCIDGNYQPIWKGFPYVVGESPTLLHKRKLLK